MRFATSFLVEITKKENTVMKGNQVRALNKTKAENEWNSCLTEKQAAFKRVEHEHFYEQITFWLFWIVFHRDFC